MKAPLIKDSDGNPCLEYSAYGSIVEKLLYLVGNFRPDISYSVSQVARFTCCPNQSHEVGLKLIGLYLLQTHNKGLIITSTCNLNIDADPDINFSGLYIYEEHNNHVCV